MTLEITGSAPEMLTKINENLEALLFYVQALAGKANQPNLEKLAENMAKNTAPAVEPEEPKTEEPKTSQAEITEITLATIQEKVRGLIAPGSKKRDAAKAIIQEYAPKISAIEMKDYGIVMARLNALEEA